MNIQLAVGNLGYFFLVFCRVAFTIGVLPVFSSNTLPAKFRIAYIAMLSYFFAHLIAPVHTVTSNTVIYLILVLKECLIGVLIGVTARFALDSLQNAGEVIAQEMGFAMANLVDPVSDMQVTTLGQVFYAVIILCFLVIDGHHMFLRVLAGSFSIVPPETFINLSHLHEAAAGYLKDMYFLSLKLAGPLLAFMFVLTAILAIMARTIPQMDILTVGFPARVAVGLFGMIAMMGYIMIYVRDIYEMTYKHLGIMMKVVS